MKNPLQEGRYLSTTSPVQATEFTYKQARAILQSKKQYLKFARTYHIVNKGNGEVVEIAKSNANVYAGENKPIFDESVLALINSEAEGILGLNAWDWNQLETYRTMLNQAWSYYDSAISDVAHAIEDINPPAHIRTKSWGILQELRKKHTFTKQQIKYIDVMKRALDEGWNLVKLKLEISKAKYEPYKGRTEYYDIIRNMT